MAVAVAVLIGLITGDMALWLTIVLGGILAWQFVNLFRLQRWLKHRAHEDPPDIGGVWGDVIAIINRIYRRKQFHKRRVTQTVPRVPPAFGRAARRRRAAVGGHGKSAGSTARPRSSWACAARWTSASRSRTWSATRSSPPTSRSRVRRQRRRHPAQGTEAWLALFVIPAGPQYLMLVRDVTREVRLEEMRKDFVANASHELRSPLTVISGYLDELAKDEGVGTGVARPVADMRRQALRMREIVEDLLELSRLEATADEAPMAPVDMPELLERLVREARAGSAGRTRRIRARRRRRPACCAAASRSCIRSPRT